MMNSVVARAAVSALLIAVSAFAEDQPVPKPPLESIRVNCGGPRHENPEGVVFEADGIYTAERGWGALGGSTASSTTPVDNAEDDTLFQTERWGVQNYTFDMKPGVYRVVLYFNEFYFSGPGLRVFDIFINGKPAFRAFDIVAQGGRDIALVVTNFVDTKDGKIVIEPREIEDRCKFSAIAVEPAEPDAIAPPAPAGLKIHERSNAVGVEWAPVEAADLQGYVVSRSDQPKGEYSRLNEVPLSDPFFVDRTITNGRTFYYRVAALDVFGNESERSDAIEGTAQPPSKDEVTIGINVGGKELTDDQDRRFEADHPYNPAVGTGYEKGGVERALGPESVPGPCRTSRAGEWSYRFDLPPGLYEVTLGFFLPPDERGPEYIFDVYLNRFRALSRFDLLDEFGRGECVEKQFVFKVGNDGLRIEARKFFGQPVLSFIHIAPAQPDTIAPPAPHIVRQLSRDAVNYIEWEPLDEQDLAGYQVLRGDSAKTGFSLVTNTLIGVNSFVDRDVQNGREYVYEVVAVDASGNESGASEHVTLKPHMPDDDEFLDIVSRAAFEYFLRECHPKTFLTKDKNTAEAISAASTGFGLSALCIGTERGWITREEGERRAYTILRTLNTPRNNRQFGLFYHYLEGDGSRSTRGYEDAVSTVDSALLMMGAVAAGEYFGGRVKRQSDVMMKRMDWKSFADPKRKQVAMVWRPIVPAEPMDPKNFDGWWDFYTDEALIIAILGASAPDEALRLPGEYFYTFKRVRKNYKDIRGVVHTWPGALFTYTFAHCWFDFRQLGPDNPGFVGQPEDLQVDWWSNTVKAAQANRLYCLAQTNKYKTFTDRAWGLSSCSGPGRYLVPGVPPCGSAPTAISGTIALYAAGMAVPFTTPEALDALRYFYTLRGPDGQKLLWKDEFDGGYGFIDAYSLDSNFFSKEVHGIDQGPMLCLIDNYRSGTLWKAVLKNEALREGLRRIGFSGPGVKK